MKNIAELKQSGKSIEPTITDLGEFFWYTEDVCRVLEISDVDQAIAELEPKVWTEIKDSPDPRATAVVIEDGLFALLLRGQAPIAKEFRRWVTSSLLGRVLLDEGPPHKLDRAIKEKLLVSGLLPNWDIYY